MYSRLSWLVWVMAFCVSDQALAAGPVRGGLHALSVPGLPDVSCGGPGSRESPKCKDTEFAIAAVQIANPAGGDPLCLAYFTYNSLTVSVGRANGGAALNWKPPADGRFHGNGIVFTAPAGVPLNKIVKSQSVGGATIKTKALLNLGFGHLPDVDLNINGKWTHCGGVDPGIVVNAD